MVFAKYEEGPYTSSETRMQICPMKRVYFPKKTQVVVPWYCDGKSDKVRPIGWDPARSCDKFVLGMYKGMVKSQSHATYRR